MRHPFWRGAFPIALVALGLVSSGCGEKDKNAAACSAMQRAVDLSDQYIRTPLDERAELRPRARKAANRLLTASRAAPAANLAFHGQRLAGLYLRQLKEEQVDDADLLGSASVVNTECLRLGHRVTTKNAN